MKKFLFICCILLLVLAALAAAVYTAVPTVGAYLLGKAIGGTVTVARFQRGYSGGAFVFDLGDVTLKGNVEGFIREWQVKFDPWKGLSIAYLAISDFELTVKGSNGGMGVVPVPVQTAELRRGTVTYKGQKYIIREIKVRNVGTGGETEFELDGTVEGLGNFKSKGGGFFRDKRSDLRGTLSYSQLSMSRLLNGYEGFLSGAGEFAFKDEKLTCVITVEAVDFVMREKFLKTPVRVAHETARALVVFEPSKLKAVVRLRNLLFNGVSVELGWTTVGNDLASLQLRTGALTVSEVQEYVDLEPLAKRGDEVLDLLAGGRITVKQLSFTNPEPFLADLRLDGVSVSQGDITVHDIDATIKLTDHGIIVSNAKGFFERSAFRDVSGNIPFAPEKEIEGKGRYSLDVRDLSALLGIDDLQFMSGITEGEAEIRGKEDTSVKVAGRGELRDADILWRNIPLKASGLYRFHDRVVDFEPLTLSRGSTRLSLTGTIQEDLVQFDCKGDVGLPEIKALVDVPYPVDGVVAVDGRLVKKPEILAAKGTLSLKHVFFEVPGFLKKEIGVEAAVALDVQRDEHLLRINSLSCGIADATLQASGDVMRGRAAGIKLSVDVPHFETLSKLLFSNRIQATGSLKLNTAVADLPLPVNALPSLEGRLSFSRGSIKLPWLIAPLTDIELNADFEGSRFLVDLAGLRIGRSYLRKGSLVVDREGGPHFSLMIDAENFEPADVEGPEKRAFRIPLIDEKSLMATLSGDMKVSADRVVYRDIVVNDVTLFGALQERRISVEKVTGTVFGGTLTGDGSADLSGPLPVVKVSMEASDIKGVTIIRLVDPESRILDATGHVSARLSSTGREKDELLREMSGTIAAESRDGVIRKWNLLSKIFGLLNVYDFFRGRVDLTKEGFPYRKAAVTLTGEKGVFRTEDFLIDSPSMVIAGQGAVNLPEGTVDGKIVVSPLQALDKTVDWIPILRSIFKRKEGGFMHVVYDVKGPLKDPELSTSYVDSIGRRPIDILKNILLLPAGVFEK